MCIERIRHKTGTDTLNFMRTGFSFGEDRRGFGLSGNDFDGGIFGFQEFAGTGESTACADTCHKNIGLSVGIVPDFGACCFKMSGRISLIDKLTENDSTINGIFKFVGFCDSPLHTFGTLCENDFGTIGFEKFSSFNAHRFGHGHNCPVTSGGSDGSNADTGIAAGRFNNSSTGFEKTFLFGIINHSFCDSVLNASGGIEIFEFGENIGRKFLISDKVVGFE